jgi:DNA polymerase-1
MEIKLINSNVEGITKHLNSDCLAIDFEASGLDPYTTVPWLFSVKPSNHNVTYVIDVQKCSLEPIRNVLESSLLIGANISYDLKLLRHMGFRPRRVYCVVVAERVLSAGIRVGENDLASIIKRRIGVSLDKEVRSSFIMLYEDAKKVDKNIKWAEAQVMYAAKDVEYLHPVYISQLEEAHRADVEYVIKCESNLVPVVADMEYVGIGFDKEKWLKLDEEHRLQKSILYGEICDELVIPKTRMTLFPETTGSIYDLNIDSPILVKKLLSSYGIDVPDTKEETLKDIDVPICKKLIEYRKLEKSITSYGRNWLSYINPVTGRIHSSFNQVRCDTGRFGSSEPNLQNIPATIEYRSCFIAPKGRKLITADYAGIELRIIAEFSSDETMIKAFNGTNDVHSETAALIFGLPVEECGKGTKYRDIGKTLNYSLLYGQGDDKLAIKLGVSLEEAAKIRAAYSERFANIMSWLEKAGEEAVKEGYCATPLGRKRWFTKNTSLYEMKASGRNTPIQGTSADMIKIAQIILNKKLLIADTDAFMVDVIHDELLVEADENIVDDVSKVIEESMVEAGSIFLKRVPIKVSLSVGDCWSKD